MLKPLNSGIFSIGVTFAFRQLLADDIELNEGMVVENAVAQTLRAAGHKLYFYSKDGRENSENRTKFAPFLDTPYVLHKKDVDVRDGVGRLPLYMAPLLVTRL